MRASICTASTIGAFGTEYFGCHQPPMVTTASRGTVHAHAEQVEHGLGLAQHQRLLVGRVAAGADADDRRRHVVAEEAGDEAAVRARAARADDDAVEGEAELEALLLQLLRAGDVAEAAERVRAAAGNDVGLAALGGERVGHLLHRLAHVGCRPARP